MKTRTYSSLACALLAGACATQPYPESPEYAARMKEAGDRYTACLSAEAEKDMKNPAGAEDIAVAAHGRCWSEWNAYREATRESFAFGAKSPEQQQFVKDKTDAHLRQYEIEARRTVVDSVVQRSLGGPKTAK